MKIQKTKCDQCGREHDISDEVIEVQKLWCPRMTQVERDAPQSFSQHQTTIWSYDMCSMKCLSEWAAKEASNPGSETAPR